MRNETPTIVYLHSERSVNERTPKQIRNVVCMGKGFILSICRDVDYRYKESSPGGYRQEGHFLGSISFLFPGIDGLKGDYRLKKR